MAAPALLRHSCPDRCHTLGCLAEACSSCRPRLGPPTPFPHLFNRIRAPAPIMGRGWPASCLCANARSWRWCGGVLRDHCTDAQGRPRASILARAAVHARGKIVPHPAHPPVERQRARLMLSSAAVSSSRSGPGARLSPASYLGRLRASLASLQRREASPPCSPRPFHIPLRHRKSCSRNFRVHHPWNRFSFLRQGP